MNGLLKINIILPKRIIRIDKQMLPHGPSFLSYAALLLPWRSGRVSDNELKRNGWLSRQWLTLQQRKKQGDRSLSQRHRWDSHRCQFGCKDASNHAVVKPRHREVMGNREAPGFC